MNLHAPPLVTADAPRTSPAPAPATHAHRGWAAAGWIAGLLTFGFFLGPAAALTVPTDALIDNELVADHLAGKEGWIWAFQTGSVLLGALVVVFGLGLRRRLAVQAPSGSLLPDVAGAGMLLVTALLLVGGGIGTEMFHSVRNVDDVDPDTLGAHLALYNTLAWVWAAGALTSGAVAVAGFRHGSVSKGLARFSAAMTALVVVTQVLPFQYLAVLPVGIFLLVAGIAMHREVGRDGDAPATTRGLVAPGAMR